jgi:hypothetical protein
MEQELEQAELVKQRKEAKAAMEQYRIKHNIPDVISVGAKTVTLFPILGYSLDRISSYLVRQAPIGTDDPAELIAKAKQNNAFQYKAISIAILNDPRLNGLMGFFKIFLFHGIHWRLCRIKYSMCDISQVLEHLVEKLGLFFFFQNTQLTRELSTLKKKLNPSELREKRKKTDLDQAEQE